MDRPAPEQDGEEPAEGWSWENGEDCLRELGGRRPRRVEQDEDFAMYFGYEEKPDPVLVDTTHWGDMDKDVTGHSYVIEVE